jgi:holo-[acyl-carrier protein] synthase
MRIIGHGIDVVSVPRIAAMAGEHGQRFLDRCFTPAEQEYCGRQRRPEHLAGRFAAKEAILKALGTGWRSGIAWTDAEVVLLPSGQPTVRLHARAAEIAAQLGIDQWSLSISHTSEYAVASAIATSTRETGL